MDSWSTISTSEYDDEVLAIEAKRALAYLQTNRKYRYVEFLAQGGYGWVSRVYDDEAGRSLVIKCTSDTSDMELSWWPRLNHPNILPLLEFITMETVTVFIMPTMRKDLWEVVNDTAFYEEELSFGLCRVWLRDVAAALAYLHGQFLCHLDLKLDNVFLKEDGYACLGDFSLLSDVREVPKDFHFLEVYEPPEYTEWCHDVDMPSLSTTTVGGDKADMWQYGILTVDLLCNLKVSGSKSSNYTLWHHDVWPLLEKIILHDDYLSYLLEKTFLGVVFKKEDFVKCHDFLKDIIRLKPEQRMSAEAAMEHPFTKTEWPQLPAEFTIPTVVDEDGREILPLPIEEMKDPSLTVEEVMAAATKDKVEKETLPVTPSIGALDVVQRKVKRLQKEKVIRRESIAVEAGKKLLDIKPKPKRLPRKVTPFSAKSEISSKKRSVGKKEGVVKTTVVQKTTPTVEVLATVKVTSVKKSRTGDASKSSKNPKKKSPEKESKEQD